MESQSLDGSKDQQKLVQRMALNDNKAGMKGLDKEKINKIIMENTVGSRYYKNEQKRDKQVQEKIRKMKMQLEKCTPQEQKDALKKANEILASIESERDLSRTIIHIDMDAFYASVEERDCPELKEKPMAVGGLNMLSTSNYVARRYGVRAAMPGFIAMKLCPSLVIVPLNFSKYREVSKECQEIFAEYDSNFMAMSLDEAYLDITDHLEKRILMSEDDRTFLYNEKLIPAESNETKAKTFGFSAEDVSDEIRFRIHQKTLLTASAGIGPNTMLSKIGSDLNKPNGQKFFMPDKDSIMEFVRQLPIRKVSGVGKVSEQLLASLGITKCGDLYERRADLVLLFSNISCSFFFRTALGCSSTHLDNETERKSISTERTFPTVSDPPELYGKLDELCESLAEDVRKKNLQGKTIVLKIKTVDFESHTRSRSSNTAVHLKDQIFGIAKELLRLEISAAKGKLALRLMGIGLSKLEPVSSTQQVSIRSFFAGQKELLASNSNKKSFDGPETSNSSVNEQHCQDGTNIASNHPTEIFEDRSHLKTMLNQNVHLPDDTDLDLIDLKDLAQKDFSSDDDSRVILDSPVVINTDSNCSEIEEKHDLEIMTCPICRVSFSSAEFTLLQFNSHIDSCLSRQEIKSILATESNNNQVRKLSPIKANPSKRRKVEKKKFHSIEKFFS